MRFGCLSLVFLPALSWGMCVPTEHQTDDVVFTMRAQQTLTLQGLNCQAEEGQGARYHTYRWTWRQQDKEVGEGLLPITLARTGIAQISMRQLNSKIIAIDEREKQGGYLILLYWATPKEIQVFTLPYTHGDGDGICSQAKTLHRVHIHRCRYQIPLASPIPFGKTLRLRVNQNGWQELNPADLAAFIP